MSNSLTASVKFVLKSNFDNVLDLSTVEDDVSLSWLDSFTNGTGANKAEVAWHDERTLTSGSSDDLDLAGALTCAFGTVTFTKIKAIAIQVTTTTAGYTLEVGGAASNAFSTLFGDSSDKLVLQAGGMICVTAPVDGYTVTADTGDILKIYNASVGSVTYDIWVIGEGSVA